MHLLRQMNVMLVDICIVSVNREKDNIDENYGVVKLRRTTESNNLQGYVKAVTESECGFLEFRLLQM